ncbi:hypothetical protein AB205_0184180 [Aquarana catesbeiana]|uniref:SGNH hydrolase-type esterase domain-containing protein n=1 Tax=Aquarana catesbeiana TaxID=8400 RepID=A0A2G9QCA5_AQUCT|nr:hypothetical protein AB205_0184180 [Aquarana catesbeiana]
MAVQRRAGGVATPRARRSQPPERYSPESGLGTSRSDQRVTPGGDTQTPGMQGQLRDGRGEVRGTRRKGGVNGGRVPSTTRGSPPPARRRCIERPEGSAREGRRGRDAQERTAASDAAVQVNETANSPPRGGRRSARVTRGSGSGSTGRSTRTLRNGRRRSPSPGASNGSSGNLERGGRAQHRRPSATTATAAGVQQEVSRMEHSDDRSEGELSGSDGGDVQGHQATVVPGVAAVGPSPGQPGREVGLVWILGYYYVFWGAKRADVRQNGRQLMIPRQEVLFRWIGVPGMQWNRVLGEVHRFSRLDRSPDVLLLHVGGNDMGARSMRDLIRDIKCDFLRLRAAYPKMVLVWSDMIRWLSWRWAWSDRKVDRARIKGQ